MNIQELFKELVSEVSRITGVKLDSNLTEAEQLSEIQKLDPVNNSNEAIELRLKAVEDMLLSELPKVTETLNGIEKGIKEEELNSKIEDSIAKSVPIAVKNAVDPVKREFATQLSDLQKLAEKKVETQQVDASIESSTEPVQRKIGAVSIGGVSYQTKK